MQEAITTLERVPSRDAVPLGLGEQIGRDAQMRLIAAAGVVLVHAAYPPGSPALATLAPAGRGLAELAFTLLVAFPVNAFVLLSFLHLAPRMQAGVRTSVRLRTLAGRMVPTHLFWTAAFLAARGFAERRGPTPGAVLEGIFLGTAAAHLYFTPLLLALTVAVPVLWWLACSPLRLLAGGSVLAVVGYGLQRTLGSESALLHAIAGFFGMAPVALAGLALARAWKGLAPGQEQAGPVRRIAGGVAFTSVLVIAGLSSARGRIAAADVFAWLATVGLALALPALLLTVRGPASSRALRLARYTLGVYFIHPFFIQALRLVEGRFAPFAHAPVALILPNFVIATCCSLGVVALLARTPLRRVVM